MKYDLVTFDIFDTLVHRRLRAPIDLFEAVRLALFRERCAILHHDCLANFAHDRRQAEHQSRARLASMNSELDEEVTLEEIYDFYQQITGCSIEIRHYLQAMELRLEKQFIFLSQKGLQKFYELQANATQMALISDMYLPSRWLGEMLQEKGFQEGSQIPIFVSCEYRKSKASGALFHEVAKCFDIQDSRQWLHVGDNLYTDVARAKAQGIRTLHAEWSLVENRRRGNVFPAGHYFVDSLLDFLELPQSSQFYPEGDYEKLGYRIFGPLVFGFMLWIFVKIRENDLKHIVFIARDGQLPCHLFEILKADVGLSQVSHSYLYFSRYLGYQLGCTEWEYDDWDAIISWNDKSIGSIIQTVGIPLEGMSHILERFGFNSPETIVTPEKSPKARALLATLFERGLRTYQKNRERYKKYFEEHFNPKIKTGLLDLGWNGNIQKYLLRSFDASYPKKQVLGLYLGLFDTARSKQDQGFLMQGWLTHYSHNARVNQYLCEGGKELAELVLTADHGTMLGLHEDPHGNITPILEEQVGEEKNYRERAMKIQRGVKKFVEDYRFLLSLYDPASISASEAWSRPFERLVTHPTMAEIDVFADMTHAVDPGSTINRRPLAQRQSQLKRILRFPLWHARRKSLWKAAFDRLNR